MEKNLKKSFGAKVKFYRNLLGLTQEQLAEKVGISYNTVSYIERGKNAISFSKISILAEALEIEPYRLFLENEINFDKDKKEEIIKVLDTANSKQISIISEIVNTLIKI